MRPVAISRWGTWTAAGTVVNAAPPPLTPGHLMPWREALPLAGFHRRLRRPHASAISLCQLAHAVWPQGLGGPVGVMLGTQAGSASADREFQSGLEQRGPGFGSPGVFVYTLASSAPSEVAIALGLRGGHQILAAGSASGLTAIAAAVAEVSAGRLDACLGGGFELHEDGTRPDWLCLFTVVPRSGQPGEVPLGPAEFGGWNAPAGPDVSEEALFQLARQCASPGNRQTVISKDRDGPWAKVAFP